MTGLGRIDATGAAVLRFEQDMLACRLQVVVMVLVERWADGAQLAQQGGWV